eukprot:jgi/Botrbrau1/3049/Bobra.0070s0045.2
MQGLSEGHGLRAGRGPRSVGSYGRRPCRRLNVSQGSHCVYSFPGYNQASDALQSAQQRFRLSIFRRGPSSPQASRETKTWSAFQDVVTVKTGGGDGGGNGGPPSSKSVGEDGDAPGPSSETANIDAILAKAGQSVQNLPKDIQEALARGAVTPADITQWLKIASTPILGAICQALPAFRDRVMGNPRFLLVLAIEEAYGLQRKADGRGPRPGKGVLAGDKHGVLGHGAGGDRGLCHSVAAVPQEELQPAAHLAHLTRHLCPPCSLPPGGKLHGGTEGGHGGLPRHSVLFCWLLV